MRQRAEPGTQAAKGRASRYRRQGVGWLMLSALSDAPSTLWSRGDGNGLAAMSNGGAHAFHSHLILSMCCLRSGSRLDGFQRS